MASYIDYVKQHWSPITALYLEHLVKHGFVDEMQSLLNKRGHHLAVDGIIGFRTLYALSKEDIVSFFEEFSTYIESKPPSKSKGKKQLIMNFLYLYEGKRIAWLRGEKAVTMPLGSYCYAVPNGRACKYGRELYKKYRLNYKKPAHARVLDARITKYERVKLMELAYDDYVDRYLNTPEAKTLDNYPKSSLSYFSIALNGGRAKGVKILQQMIGVKVDGKAGEVTLGELKEYVAIHRDSDMNQTMLGLMASFYKYLIHRHSKAHHYAQFAKGWCNRIKATGYKTKEVRC